MTTGLWEEGGINITSNESVANIVHFFDRKKPKDISPVTGQMV